MAAMSDERLAEIRQQVQQGAVIWQVNALEFPPDIARQVELLAEVDRLRAKMAAYERQIEAMGRYIKDLSRGRVEWMVENGDE